MRHFASILITSGALLTVSLAGNAASPLSIAVKEPGAFAENALLRPFPFATLYDIQSNASLLVSFDRSIDPGSDPSWLGADRTGFKERFPGARAVYAVPDDIAATFPLKKGFAVAVIDGTRLCGTGEIPYFYITDNFYESPCLFAVVPELDGDCYLTGFSAGEVQRTAAHMTGKETGEERDLKEGIRHYFFTKRNDLMALLTVGAKVKEIRALRPLTDEQFSSHLKTNLQLSLRRVENEEGSGYDLLVDGRYSGCKGGSGRFLAYVFRKNHRVVLLPRSSAIHLFKSAGKWFLLSKEERRGRTGAYSVFRIGDGTLTLVQRKETDSSTAH